jgi:Tfp pilus assembly protein PilV
MLSFASLMKKSTIKSTHASGFTLLEVLLVIIMLMLVFIPLLQMLATGMSASEEVKSTNTAVMLAQKKLEEIRNISSWGSITAESLTALSPTYPAYSRQVSVTDLGNLKDVRVMVYWGTGGQKADSISIETYISNY